MSLLTIQDRAGVLYCNEHEKEWCNCIQEFMKKHMDASQIAYDVAHASGGSWQVSVPILPAEDIFALVDLTHKNVTLFSAWLMHPAPSVNFCSRAGDPFFMLTIGEGRLVIRNTIIQWFVSGISNDWDAPECKSRFHNWKVHGTLMGMLRNDRSVIVANGWTTEFYERCLLCFRLREEEDMPFDVDLLPGA